MPAKIVSFQDDPWNKSKFEDHDGIAAGAVHEIHTGHLPKAKHAATSGPLDRMERTYSPMQQMEVQQIVPARQRAGLYEITPPVTHWVRKYSRVVTYHY